MSSSKMSPTKLNNLIKSKKTDLAGIVVYIIMAVLIIGIGVYVYNKSTLNQRNCNILSKVFDKFPKISSIVANNEQFSHNLRDYYIKTSYNCCSGGQFKNDYVNVCALENAIKQGARCLDFEIYSVDNKPVIAVSSANSFTYKETYNSVPFNDAMRVIGNYAFSNSHCPNPDDPLMLHFRIMSDNKQIYKSMAETLYTTLSNRLLGKKYSYEYHGYNIGEDPIMNYKGKIIIAVDKSNPTYYDTPLREYINITSNSPHMRLYRESQVIYTHDMDELIDFNKIGMTLVLPNLSANSNNAAVQTCMLYGCQMVGVSFQTNDADYQYYTDFFNNAGYAFKLKPEKLRNKPKYITIPPPPKVGLNTIHEKEMPGGQVFTLGGTGNCNKDKKTE